MTGHRPSRTREQFRFTDVERSAIERVVHLYGRYHPDYLYGRHNPDDIEQEAMIAVWRARGRWDGGGIYRAYAYLAARTAAIDELRRLSRVERRTAWVEATDRASSEPTPEQLVVDRRPELCGYFTARQQYLAARLAAGATKQDIAAELGVSPGQVSHILADIRTRVVEPVAA